MDKLLKSKISNKIVILLTIFIILLSSINADTLSDYQKQIDDLKNEQKQNAEKLTGIEKEIEQKDEKMLDCFIAILIYAYGKDSDCY